MEFQLSFAKCWELAGTGLREVWWVLESHLGSVSSFAFYSFVTGAAFPSCGRGTDVTRRLSLVWFQEKQLL